MFIRNHKGQIVIFHPNVFFNEYDKYTKLWKIKYDIDLDKVETKRNVLRSVLDYVNGIKDFV